MPSAALTHKRKKLHDADQVGMEGILLASRPSEEKSILSSLSAFNLVRFPNPLYDLKSVGESDYIQPGRLPDRGNPDSLPM